MPAVPGIRSDGLGMARAVALTTAGVCLTIAAVVWLHQSWVAPRALQEAEAALQATGLSTPAWAPSGQPLRLADKIPAGVDLRYSPLLPPIEPGTWPLTTGPGEAERTP
jgi:hypothetical protein